MANKPLLPIRSGMFVRLVGSNGEETTFPCTKAKRIDINGKVVIGLSPGEQVIELPRDGARVDYVNENGVTFETIYAPIVKEEAKMDKQFRVLNGDIQQ